ncbi:MAG: amidohydrolase family protein [Sphingomonadales bacterium]
MIKSKLLISVALFGLVISSSVMAEDIAITGGNVVTMGPNGTIKNGTVLISDGKITSVGAGISVPQGYKIIDASGRIVTPGIVVGGSSIGISEVSAVAGTQDGSLTGDNAHFTASFDVSWALNPNVTHKAIARVEGVTRAISVPRATNNIFSGQAAAIHLGDGVDILVKPKVAMSVSLGVSGGNRVGGSRAAAITYVRKALDEAGRVDGRGWARGAPSRERDSLLSRMDAEALIPVLNGDIPMLVSVTQASDILQVIRLGQDYKDLNIIITGANEAHLVADELASAGIPVIINPENNLPSNFASLASTLYSAGRLEAANVSVSFAGGQPRLVTQVAGNAVAHGMSWQGALEGITINPARAFGLDGSIGSLEIGKEGDVVIWNGDPLELSSSPDVVIIKGEEIEMVSRQTKLRDRYMDLKKWTKNKKPK